MATGHKGVAPAILYALMNLSAKRDVVHGFALGTSNVLLLVLMNDTPHPAHTHSRSSLYIYKVF